VSTQSQTGTPGGVSFEPVSRAPQEASVDSLVPEDVRVELTMLLGQTIAASESGESADEASARICQLLFDDPGDDHHQRASRLGVLIGRSYAIGKAIRNYPSPHDGRGNVRSPHPMSQRKKETP